MAQVFPDEDGDVLQEGSCPSNVKKAPTLASKKTLKLPGCAYHIALSRANHFSKIAFLAFMCTSSLAVVKYYFATQGEDDLNLQSLRDTAKSLARSVQLQIEADLEALDGVANLWHLDSKMKRHTFREYIKSKFFASNLQAMQTVLLTERVQPHNRDAIETDPDSVQLRRDCCSGTKYNVPDRDLYCVQKASSQCSIEGEDRYYFTEKTQDGVLLASRNDQERLIVMYQEPFKENPGPTGLDMLSLPTRRDAWWLSAETGKKAMTKRMERVFSPGEFGLLIWNNLFVDKLVDGSKSPMIDGVNLMTKHELESQGKEPFSIASVVAVFEVQHMFVEIITRIFEDSQSLLHTTVWLLDSRDDTGERERILAMWQWGLTQEQMREQVMEKQAMTMDELRNGNDMAVIEHIDGLDGVADGTKLSLMVVPSEDYLALNRSPFPIFILLISLALACVAQAERWVGHPIVISSTRLWQAKIEKELREEVEDEIVRSASQNAIAVASASEHPQYVYTPP